MKIKEVFIIIEDKYGKIFIEKILAKLGKSSIKVSSARGKGRIVSPRLKRLLDNALRIERYKRVVILIDGDGDAKKVKKRLYDIIPSEYKDRTTCIVFEYEIEEWITHALKIRAPKSIKPSVALNEYLRNTKGEGYEKNMLPEFSDIIDVSSIRKLKTFREFEKSI